MNRRNRHWSYIIVCLMLALLTVARAGNSQGWPGESSPKVAPFHFLSLANIPPTWDPQGEKYTDLSHYLVAPIGQQWGFYVTNYNPNTTMAVRTFATLIPPLSPKLDLGTHYSRFAPDGLTFMVMNGVPPFSGPPRNNMNTGWIGLQNIRYGPGLWDWRHDVIGSYVDIPNDLNLVGVKFYVEGLCGLSTSGYIDPPIGPFQPLRVAQPTTVDASFGLWEAITITP